MNNDFLQRFFPINKFCCQKCNEKSEIFLFYYFYLLPCRTKHKFKPIQVWYKLKLDSPDQTIILCSL